MDNLKTVLEGKTIKEIKEYAKQEGIVVPGGLKKKDLVIEYILSPKVIEEVTEEVLELQVKLSELIEKKNMGLGSYESEREIMKLEEEIRNKKRG